MNKELEEAIKVLNSYINAIDTFGTIDYKCINNLYKPVKTILKALDNSISKEVIEKKIEELKNIKSEKDNELDKVSEEIQKQIGTETDLDSAYQYYDETYDERQELIYQINILQKLLEGK